MAAPDSGRERGEARGLETAIGSAPGRGAPASVTDRPLEEVTVCRLCGLVMRRPFPPECPACGGGFG